MVYTSLMLVLVMVAVAVLIGMAAVGLLKKERALDARLRSPETPTIAYAVPEGVDPVIVGAALSAAGFANVLEEVDGVRWLRIEALPEDSGVVRELIERVYAEEYDPALHLPPVEFREVA